MKKVLLGTTALVAASVAMGSVAQAEEPISVGVGGYYRAAMAFINQDNADGEPADGNHSIALAQDIEISISGSTTLDNGITVGVNFLIEGNSSGGTSSNSLDERFLFFRGGFGQIRVGSTESARQEMTNFAPSGAYNFGVNTPFFQMANPGNGAGIFNVRTYSDGLGVEDSLKLVYFSPTFNGFRVGASYAPDDAEFGQYGANASETVGGLSHQTSISGEYNGDFGDFGLRVAAGYETYNLERCAATAAAQTCDDSPESIHVGATVSFGSISIGGGWLDSDIAGAADVNGNNRSREDFDVGINYWSGPFGVGLLYGSASVDAADGTDDEVDIIAVNGTYILGPGIDVEAQVDFGSFDDGTVGALDNDWVELLVGTAITF